MTRAVTLSIRLNNNRAVLHANDLRIRIARVIFIAGSVKRRNVLLFAQILGRSRDSATRELLRECANVRRHRYSNACHDRKEEAIKFRGIEGSARHVERVLEGLALRATPYRITIASFAATCAALNFDLANERQERIVIGRRARLTLIGRVVRNLLIRLHARDADERELYLAANGGEQAIEAKRQACFAPSEAGVNYNATIGALPFVRCAAARNVALRVIMMAIGRDVLLDRFAF